MLDYRARQPSLRRAVNQIARVSALACSLVAGVTWIAPAAHAQQRVDGDGRLLDNNLQVGAGRANPQQAQPDYRLRNDLITGNVTGLGYFHDSVGYGSVGEFSGRLGTDDLFRFRATSVSPGLIPSGPDAAAARFGPSSIRRSLSPTTAGSVVDGRLTVPSYDNTAGSYSRSRTADGLIIDADSLTGDSRAARFGVGRTGDGRILELTASPLLGVRAQALPETKLPGTTPSPSPTQPGSTVPRIGIEPDAPAVPQRLEGAALYLGDSLTSASVSARIQDVGTFDEQVQRLEASLFSPLGSRSIEPGTPGSPGSPGSDVYMDLLAQVRARQETLAGRPASKPLPNVLVPLPETDAAATGTDAGGRPLVPLPEPTAQELAAAERERNNALRRARGLPLEADPSDRNTDEPDATADLDPTLSEDEQRLADARQRLARLMDVLDHDLPAVRTLAGDSEDAFSELLREAESLIRAGDYFDAEAAYRRALVLRPNHPLARVGQAHAQLGAGLTRTAAANLRALFEAHPELIATRYDPRLLPAARRLAQLDEQLRKLAESGDRPDAGMMLAYLGFQIDSPRLTRFGLALAETQTPRDPLWPVLRTIWLRQPDNQTDEKTTPGTDAEPDTQPTPDQ